MEVGFSEALSMLRRNAKWWLESSPAVASPDGTHKAAVQQVIIIKVDRCSLTKSELEEEKEEREDVSLPAPRLRSIERQASL